MAAAVSRTLRTPLPKGTVLLCPDSGSWWLNSSFVSGETASALAKAHSAMEWGRDPGSKLTQSWGCGGGRQRERKKNRLVLTCLGSSSYSPPPTSTLTASCTSKSWHQHSAGGEAVERQGDGSLRCMGNYSLKSQARWFSDDQHRSLIQCLSWEPGFWLSLWSTRNSFCNLEDVAALDMTNFLNLWTSSTCTYMLLSLKLNKSFYVIIPQFYLHLHQFYYSITTKSIICSIFSIYLA